MILVGDSLFLLDYETQEYPDAKVTLTLYRLFAALAYFGTERGRGFVAVTATMVEAEDFRNLRDPTTPLDEVVDTAPPYLNSNYRPSLRTRVSACGHQQGGGKSGSLSTASS